MNWRRWLHRTPPPPPCVAVWSGPLGRVPCRHPGAAYTLQIDGGATTMRVPLRLCDTCGALLGDCVVRGWGRVQVWPEVAG